MMSFPQILLLFRGEARRVVDWWYQCLRPNVRDGQQQCCCSSSGCVLAGCCIHVARLHYERGRQKFYELIFCVCLEKKIVQFGFIL